MKIMKLFLWDWFLKYPLYKNQGLKDDSLPAPLPHLIQGDSGGTKKVVGRWLCIIAVEEENTLLIYEHWHSENSAELSGI